MVSVILKLVIKILARWQKPGSITEEQLKIAKSLWKMQFINMALVPFLIQTSMLNFFDVGGLVEEINLILMLNMILPHILEYFFNFPYWISKFQRYRLFKFIDTGKGGIFNQK